MAMLFTLLLGVSAAILGYFLYDFGKQGFLRETEAAIDSEITMLSGANAERTDAIISYVSQRSSRDPAVHFRYEDENGKLLAGTIKNMPAHPQPLAEGVLRFVMDTPNGKQILAAKIHTFSNGSRIIVARNINSLIASYERLKDLSLLIMGLMLAVVLVSFGISHFVVSRINRIASTARNIMATGDLSQRISIDTRWDDLSILSQVLNGFLMQVESLMHGIREVSNNIAHDLRTPLTSLRNDIESLKQQPVVREPQLDALLGEADRILAIFQSLLRITNIEQGKRHQSFTPVDLHTVLRDVVELYEPVAEEKNIILKTEFAQQAIIRGDVNLLFQLFANLLDNAIKFSPACSMVALSVATSESVTTVLIEDSGLGIPVAEKEHVFKHFYRGDMSRSTAGNGLGLSLVKAVVELHRGRILLEDNAPGLKVRIELQPYQ